VIGAALGVAVSVAANFAGTGPRQVHAIIDRLNSK